MIATSIDAIGLGVIGLGTVRPFIDPEVGLTLVVPASFVASLVLHGIALHIVSKARTDE